MVRIREHRLAGNGVATFVRNTIARWPNDRTTNVAFGAVRAECPMTASRASRRSWWAVTIGQRPCGISCRRSLDRPFGTEPAQNAAGCRLRRNDPARRADPVGQRAGHHRRVACRLACCPSSAAIPTPACTCLSLPRRTHARKGAHVCMVYDPRGSQAFLVIMSMPSLTWAHFLVRLAADRAQ